MSALKPGFVQPALTFGQVLEEELVHLQAPAKSGHDTGDGSECDETVRLARLYEKIHAADQPRSALCLSGGGIRSAGFSLGVIQGLAKRNLLSKIDYLSTVSGGGYIGGWLSAWIHRHSRGVDGVSEELGAGAPKLRSACSVEPVPVRHLREYASYLAPRLGIFSLDMWTLAATYLRNLLLNWLVLIPLLAGLLLVPQLYMAALDLSPNPVATKIVGFMNGPLWVFGTVVAILWIPSMHWMAERERTGGERARRPGPHAIAWKILVPITVATAVSTLRRKWAPDIAGPGIYYLIYEIGGFYIIAGAIASMLLWRRSRNPSFARLWYLLAAGFITAVTSVWGIRKLIELASRSLNKVPQDVVRYYAKEMATFGVPVQLGIFLVLLTIFTGLTSRDSGPDADEDREWWGRLMGAILRIAFAWMLVTAIAVYARAIWGLVKQSTVQQSIVAAVSAVSGAVGMLGGFSTSSGEHAKTEDLTVKQRVARLLPSIGSKIFVLVFFLGMSALVDSALEATHYSGWFRVVGSALRPVFGSHIAGAWLVFLAVLLAVVFTYVMIVGRILELNRLSLHAMFRTRLVRTFLGASNIDRDADTFTGFDRMDNLPMHHLRKQATPSRQKSAMRPTRTNNDAH